MWRVRPPKMKVTAGSGLFSVKITGDVGGSLVA
jgi:hypothetical protein